MESLHKRKYVVGAVALVRERLRYSLKMMDQDNIEALLVKSKFFVEAPFLWISMIYRYGIKNDLKAEFQRINNKYGDLPIAVELDTTILEWADRNNLGLLHEIFMIAALEALIQVAQKYKLPIDPIEDERKKYGEIPNTIEECELYPNPPIDEIRRKYKLKDLIVNKCRNCGAIKATEEAEQCLECGEFTKPMLE